MNRARSVPTRLHPAFARRYASVMSEPVIRPARPDDAAALAVLGRQTFIDTFVTGFGIPYPTADLTMFLDASFNAEASQAMPNTPICLPTNSPSAIPITRGAIA